MRVEHVHVNEGAQALIGNVKRRLGMVLESAHPTKETATDYVTVSSNADLNKAMDGASMAMINLICGEAEAGSA